jgi:hypothetical protein
MLIKITKNITCDSLSWDCSNNILSKIEEFTGKKFHASNGKEKVTGHVSISHQAGNHVIWVFFYSENGKGEQEAGQDIRTTNKIKSTLPRRIEKITNSRVKKYTGTIPTESEIKKLLESKRLTLEYLNK